eukprot:CAMPEP_0178840792 /NCGR_PEP_ID=MMETSP0746-20121128/14604_1 /TAXON_ID=913974 /ORGANISM="Nitzschia punctata, Strain CCMP561" /LENGTH=675 /DNA_ID=CAMNT_0020503967 /DNA_START=79 /DNA_END=2107 /DNA_ORIENTATION=-
MDGLIHGLDDPEYRSEPGYTYPMDGDSQNAVTCGTNSSQRKGMGPFVTARPPRAPKPSTSSASLPAHQDKSLSSTRPRSSSQPRASNSSEDTGLVQHLPTEVLLNLDLHKPIFCKVLNLAECFDVRSIPDPPSPAATRKSRRLSTPVMINVSNSWGNTCFKGLSDATNQGRNQTELVPYLKESSNRKRKSLSHVPTTLALEGQKNEASSNSFHPGREENNNVEVKPRSQQSSSLCIEEDDLQLASVSSKRRKKRQSMVLPKQTEMFIPSESPKASSQLSNQTRPTPSKKSFPGDLQSMQELRKLVRGYCSRSETERSSSSEAVAIRDLTGYPLFSDAPAKKSGMSSKEILANRRLVFQKISPVMIEMEKQKELDTKQWERDTGCRVGKSNKSGKYRYFCIETNQKVASQEYKRRYMSVLEDGRPHRVQTALAWIENLKPEATTDNHHHYEDSFMTASGPNESRGSFANTFEQARDIRTNEAELREAFLPPVSNLLAQGSNSGSSEDDDEDTMELCDLSVSLDCGEHANARSIMKPTPVSTTMTAAQRDEPAEISEASSLDTEESGSRASTPSPLPLDLFAAANGFTMEESKVPTGKPVLVDSSKADAMAAVEASRGTPLLPLPSRDAESVDPDVAQAERRLWEKIDNALHEYSEEVAKIMKSRPIGAREQTKATM